MLARKRQRRSYVECYKSATYSKQINWSPVQGVALLVWKPLPRYTVIRYTASRAYTVLHSMYRVGVIVPYVFTHVLKFRKISGSKLKLINCVLLYFLKSINNAYALPENSLSLSFRAHIKF